MSIFHRMENRRQHFRYSFTPRFYWRAAFRAVDNSAAFSADIINLSVGGICVRSDLGPAAIGERWIVTISLATNGSPLQIPVQRVHVQDAEAGVFGFRFLPLPSAAEQDEQDRLIWRFLLEEQRRSRREAHWSQQTG